MARSGGAALLLVLLHSAAGVSGFSTFAGSCKHAGVNHGLDKFAAQECVRAPRRAARAPARACAAARVRVVAHAPARHCRAGAAATAGTRCRCRARG
jgi:hypothetical protein